MALEILLLRYQQNWRFFEKGVLPPHWKGFFVPHLLKRGFCVPLCHEKTLPKIESRVEKVADLLDYLQDYSDTSLQGESWRVGERERLLSDLQGGLA
jgi:hypothetical protein